MMKGVLVCLLLFFFFLLIFNLRANKHHVCIHTIQYKSVLKANFYTIVLSLIEDVPELLKTDMLVTVDIGLLKMPGSWFYVCIQNNINSICIKQQQYFIYHGYEPPAPSRRAPHR